MANSKGWFGFAPYFSTLALCLSALLIYACGGGSSGGVSTTDSKGVTISGRAVLNSISNAQVSTYHIQPKGYRDNLITTSSTNENGEYLLVFAAEFNKPFEVVVTGGSYVDEATGQPVAISSIQELRAFVPGGVSDGDAVTVSALTHVATLQAEVLMGNGNDISSSIRQANENIADKFQLGGVDILKTDPANLTDLKEVDPIYWTAGRHI